jgi:predicted PurR-regulated permease PerM
MADRLSSLRGWTTFAGCLLVVAALHWAQAIFVPVCLAILITFVLTPPVIWLQRRIGRVAAVVALVTLVSSALGISAWAITRQMSSLSADLVTYRANIRQKVRDVRGARQGGSVEKLQTTLEQIKKDMGVEDAPKGTFQQPVVVTGDQLPGLSAFGWLGPFMEPASTAGFVIVLVLFMLLEREQLRDRLIGLIGHGHLAITTKAFDEAGRRVSRQLLLQTLVNAIYGGIAAVGLWFFGSPYPFFWGAIGAALRFIPYIGPVVAAVGPILISLAALPGWTRPLEVAGFYALLELFTNLVLETVLYAGAAGVSQVALLVSVAFWTWLWGPLGLLMATPLTVCLVVLGKHVPGLTFVATMLSDAPALAPEYGYYQRLLARDVAEAADVIDRYVKTQPIESVYDALLVPALNYAERDRLQDQLEPDDEQAVIDGTRELMNDGPLVNDAGGLFSEDSPATQADDSSASPLRVLGYGTNGGSDGLALDMLARLLKDLPIDFEQRGSQLLAADLIKLVGQQGYNVVCIADLPPSAPSKTRYLVRRLHAAFPDLSIVVGRWAPPALADETMQPILDAGATHVAATLLETRRQLAELTKRGTQPALGSRKGGGGGWMENSRTSGLGASDTSLQTARPGGRA